MATELSRFWGNTARLTLPLTHPDTGEAFDPKDHALVFAVKLHPSLADTAAALLLRSSDIASPGAFARGTPATSLVVTLKPADWAGLVTGVAYYCDVLAQHLTTGELLTVFSGRLTALPVCAATPPLEITPPAVVAVTDEDDAPITDELASPVTS